MAPRPATASLKPNHQRADQAEADRDRTPADGAAHEQTIAALRDELAAASTEAATAVGAVAAATTRAEAAEQRLDALLADTARTSANVRNRRSNRTQPTA